MKAIAILFIIIGIAFVGAFELLKQKDGDFNIYTVSNKDLQITSHMIVNSLKSSGFIIGENANIQAELLHLYGDNNFKIYNNISFYHPEITPKLLNKEADAGVFIPAGMVIYQDINEDNLHIVIPRASMQMKVIGEDSPELKDLENATKKVITTLFPTAIHTYNEDSKAENRKLITKYALPVNGTDIDDIREELEENFEEVFLKEGFAMPGYFDLTDSLGEDSPYDFYVTYAICKIKVLRTVVKLKPEAAVLGPCTTMIYKKKDEQKIVMGFSSIYNWVSSAHIEDKVLLDELQELQRAYESILKEVTQN